MHRTVSSRVVEIKEQPDASEGGERRDNARETEAYLVFDRGHVALLPPVHSTGGFHVAGLHEQGPLEPPLLLGLVAVHQLPELLVSLEERGHTLPSKYARGSICRLDTLKRTGWCGIPIVGDTHGHTHSHTHTHTHTHHVAKVIHAHAVGVLANRVLQVVQLNFHQVLLPNHPPPALLPLSHRNTSNQMSRYL